MKQEFMKSSEDISPTKR